MTIEDAIKIISQLESSVHKSFANKVITSGIRYARLRVDWKVSTPQERSEMDIERTIAHDAFISSCDILARNMKNHHEDSSWRTQIGSDRKDIGDFACWIHLVLGLRAR